MNISCSKSFCSSVSDVSFAATPRNCRTTQFSPVTDDPFLYPTLFIPTSTRPGLLGPRRPNDFLLQGTGFRSAAHARRLRGCRQEAHRLVQLPMDSPVTENQKNYSGSLRCLFLPTGTVRLFSRLNTLNATTGQVRVQRLEHDADLLSSAAR